MCGRLNVSDDPLSHLVSHALGIDYQANTNPDLRPSEQIAAIAQQGQLRQIDARWGIKPSWSKRLIINAQAETVAEKRTFQPAFADHRCVVPCMGWYEWHTADGRKQKYLFENAQQQALYLAAVYYEERETKLVILTAPANDQCAAFHHRMPLLLAENSVRDWLSLPAHCLGPLLMPSKEALRISAAA